MFVWNSIIGDDTLLKILDLPILVVLDEAYIEFSGIESKMQWVKKHENLIVLRTFSKRAGRFIRPQFLTVWNFRKTFLLLLFQGVSVTTLTGRNSYCDTVMPDQPHYSL